MKILFIIIGIFCCLIIILLMAKLYVRATILYTDIKKEVRCSLLLFFKLIKVAFVFDFMTSKGEVVFIIFGVPIKRDFSFFYKGKGKKQDSDKEQPKDYKETKQKEDVSKNIPFIRMVKQLHTIGKDFLHKVALERLKIHMTYGIEDAAITGMSFGVLWTTYGIIWGTIKSLIKVNCTPDIEVHPYYQGTLLKMDGACVLSIRPIYALIYGIKVFKLFQHEKNIEEGHVSSTSL
ncbi:MAG: DUF2953 domain-containing protein [Bacillaceae bacterium]